MGPNYNLTEFLLEKGCDPNATDRDGNTILMNYVGTRKSHQKFRVNKAVVKSLLKYGADLNITNNFGQSIYDIVDIHHPKILKIISQWDLRQEIALLRKENLEKKMNF